MGSTLGAALWYANQGWLIFPIFPIEDGRCSCNNPQCARPGKHPAGALVPNGLHDATTDPAIIKGWWNRVKNWNIGTSSHFRIDVDTKNNGLDNWRDLVAENGGYEPTPACKTPSGGLHLYFKPGDDYGHTNQTGMLPAGIDVRGDGSGYTILPPSNHKEGLYEWAATAHPRNIPIASAPDWLALLVGVDKEPAGRAEFSGQLPPVDIEKLDVSNLVKALLQQDRSRVDECVITALLLAGLSDDEIRAIFTRRAPTEKYGGLNGQGDKYLALSIGKARAWIAENQKRPRRSRL